MEGCPAETDTGASRNVVILSYPEGSIRLIEVCPLEAADHVYSHSEAPLLPKLRGNFAEFLNES